MRAWSTSDQGAVRVGCNKKKHPRAMRWLRGARGPPILRGVGHSRGSTGCAFCRKDRWHCAPKAFVKSFSESAYHGF